jgi:hypothetical protein
VHNIIKLPNLDVYANLSDGNCVLWGDGANGRVAKAPHNLPVVGQILTYLFSTSGITSIFVLSQTAYLPLLSPRCQQSFSASRTSTIAGKLTKQLHLLTAGVLLKWWHMRTKDLEGLSSIPVTQCYRPVLSQACKPHTSDVTRKTAGKEKRPMISCSKTSCEESWHMSAPKNEKAS